MPDIYDRDRDNPYNAPDFDYEEYEDPNPQPVIPEPQTFGSLTAEQWFTPEYHTDEYSQYWDPFLQEGQNWEDLATTYAGMPVVSGYWTGEGEDKVFTPTKSLYSITSQLSEFRISDHQLSMNG